MCSIRPMDQLFGDVTDSGFLGVVRSRSVSLISMRLSPLTMNLASRMRSRSCSHAASVCVRGGLKAAPHQAPYKLQMWSSRRRPFTLVPTIIPVALSVGRQSSATLRQNHLYTICPNGATRWYAFTIINAQDYQWTLAHHGVISRGA